uniref:Ubiquitin-like protein ATG12 n=1 Tax=Lycosa singoriensis TaxID=434756 RepID=A9QQ60_LYCSI|nr:autophagy-related protein 12 [Lycosa singoriensis]
MAGVVDHDTAGVIKKELEDVAESPEQTEVQDSPQNQSEANGSQKQTKVTLWLKPTGNAPILKNKKWTVEKKQTIAMIMVFLKKYMNLEPSASMFLYVNQSFAPSPDIEVGSIYDCFNINGKLVLHYSTSPAWG